MVLELAIANLDRWDVTLLATDINRHALQAAERVSTASGRFEGCRTTCGGVFSVTVRRFVGSRAHVRRRVRFAYLNLGEDAYPSELNNTSAMDLIVCRNVLMYFTPERAAQVLGRLDVRSGTAAGSRWPPRSSGCSGRPVQLSSVRLAMSDSCARPRLILLPVGQRRPRLRALSRRWRPPPGVPRAAARKRRRYGSEEDAFLRPRTCSLSRSTLRVGGGPWQGGCSLGTPAMRWRWLFLRAFTANLGRWMRRSNGRETRWTPRTRPGRALLCMPASCATSAAPARPLCRLSARCSSIRTSRWPITHLGMLARAEAEQRARDAICGTRWRASPAVARMRRSPKAKA